MKLKVGQSLVSAMDDTSVIVIRAPDSEVELTCGGVPMYGKGASPVTAEPDPAHLNGSQLGKRYSDDADTLEVLCTKGGAASLALDGSPLSLRAAKPLPASD